MCGHPAVGGGGGAERGLRGDRNYHMVRHTWFKLKEKPRLPYKARAANKHHQLCHHFSWSPAPFML